MGTKVVPRRVEGPQSKREMKRTLVGGATTGGGKKVKEGPTRRDYPDNPFVVLDRNGLSQRLEPRVMGCDRPQEPRDHTSPQPDTSARNQLWGYRASAASNKLPQVSTETGRRLWHVYASGRRVTFRQRGRKHRHWAEHVERRRSQSQVSACPLHVRQSTEIGL